MIYARFAGRFSLAGQLAAAAVAAVPLLGVAPAHAATSAVTIAVRGTVMASGKADTNAAVFIYAWPSQAKLQALKVGQTVPRILVGKSTTDSSGKYSINLPVAKLAGEATSGVVNLQVGTSTVAQNLPVVIAKDSGNADITGAPVVNLQGSKKHASCNQPYDSWRYIKNMKKHWGTVGQTYVDATDATQQFSYMEGQLSSIGTGTSNSGSHGSFSADGSSSVANSRHHSSGGTWPVYGARRSVWYRTQFHFGEYQCHVYGVATHYYEIRANGYDGGAHIEKPSSVPGTRDCENYVSGFKFRSNSSTAKTWRRTWGIHAGLGFDASIVTGYDKSAAVVYKLRRSRDICGTNDYPGGSPRQLVVRK